MPGTDPLKKKSSKPLVPRPSPEDPPTLLHSSRQELFTRLIGSAPLGEGTLPTAISPEMIDGLSVDQILDLMAVLNRELRKRNLAGSEQATAVVAKVSFPKDISIDPARVSDSDFHVLPARLANKADANRTRVSLVLFSAQADQRPLAVHAIGDVIIGRNVEGANCDLNLTPYDVNPPSVSRVHALIRPSNGRLYLSDLDSTNGTFVDESRVEHGKVVELKDGSTIAFGKSQFKLRILSIPRSH